MQIPRAGTDLPSDKLWQTTIPHRVVEQPIRGTGGIGKLELLLRIERSHERQT